MKLKIKIVIFLVFLALLIILLINFKFTGNIITETDNFSHLTGLHWTHMPLTYSIKNCENPDGIKKALSLITSQTNNAVYFEESINADIQFACSQLKDCYQNKTERRWFWIATTEAICEHEAGTAQITKMKINKILNAKINIIETGKEDNCSETQIHEILHVFNFQHSQNNESIMYPEKNSMQCNELIDKDIIAKLEKYKL